MATDKSYIEFVCGQLNGYCAKCRKMFGEYMVYVDDKPVLLVCDNTVYVKTVAELSEILANAETGYPYDGAKLHYVLDIEDEELTAKVIAVLLSVTPLPKKKTK